MSIHAFHLVQSNTLYSQSLMNLCCFFNHLYLQILIICTTLFSILAISKDKKNTKGQLKSSYSVVSTWTILKNHTCMVPYLYLKQKIKKIKYFLQDNLAE